MPSWRRGRPSAEFCYAMARRKVLYELEFPETKHGTNQHRRSRNNCDSSTDRYTAKAAELSGKSERHIQEAARIGKELGRKSPKLAVARLARRVVLRPSFAAIRR